MAGRGRIAGFAHDGPHRTPRTGGAGNRRDVTIGRHASGWNPPHRSEHAMLERRGHSNYRSPSSTARPSAIGSFTPARSARVGAMSAGVTLAFECPLLIAPPRKIIGTCVSYS